MSSMNSMRLRELIRSVRQCKTASEERALVSRECANIRQGFKENTPYLRTRNMLKLLYIHMLGYATEFGQLEVVNLISQADFAGKRIGYLALQLLLDEKDEVLTLSENRMKSDMACGNPLVQAVALHAAANVASEDMARDIFDEVMKLVVARNPYVKKKACLTALRVVKKVPEHAEYFLESFTDIFTETHSSNMLCALTLVNTCLASPEGAEFIPRYRKLAAQAVRVLKSLVLSSRVTESDIGGVTDPFLQVKLLQFMRIIGRGSSVTSEALNDVLAQVITNTDASRNVGCAVHYECVRTIDGIESDEGLRTLAINTIGRFLSSSRDNNLRFVALQTLLDYAKRDIETVQQQQSVILECLKDVDVSIRRRALELTVALITESNVRLLVPDLLTYLSLCSEEIREDVTLHVCRIIEEHSPTNEWRVDLSLKLLKLARNLAPLNFAIRLIGVLSCQSGELQTHAVRILWEEASFPFDAIHQARKAFLVVALWCLGEYADYLVAGVKVSPTAIATCLGEITSNSSAAAVKQYGLTALIKLATRFPETKEIALSTFGGLLSSLDCELQQRAREYTVLLKKFAPQATAGFARMPAVSAEAEEEVVKPVPVVSPEVLEQQTANALDDLFNFDAGSGTETASPTTVSVASPLSPPQRETSVIDDLFGGPPPGVSAPAVPSAPAAAAAVASPQQPHRELDALFGGGGNSAVASASPSAAPMAEEEVVHTSDDFTVLLSNTTYRPGGVKTTVVIRSNAPEPLQDVSCLLATLKTCQLTSSALSARDVPPHGAAKVEVDIDTRNETKFVNQLKLRLVLSYKVHGTPREAQINVTSHPK